MRLLDFVTMLVALTAAMGLALVRLYGLSIPYWRFVSYEKAYLTVLLFCCIYQMGRMLARLGSDEA